MRQLLNLRKKSRDQIRCKYAFCSPFRRSGLWMTIKIVFQIILTKHFGQIGNLLYKILITHFLFYVAQKEQKTMSSHLLVHCSREIVQRLNKIDNMPSTTDNNQKTTSKIFFPNPIGKMIFESKVKLKSIYRIKMISLLCFNTLLRHLKNI